MDRIDFDDGMNEDDIANTGVDLAATEAVVAEFLRTLGENRTQASQHARRRAHVCGASRIPYRP
jgi:hypothetical protein